MAILALHTNSAQVSAEAYQPTRKAMPDFNFDPSTALDAYRGVFAPTLRAQQQEAP
jgi:hypothetical protein